MQTGIPGAIGAAECCVREARGAVFLASISCLDLINSGRRNCEQAAFLAGHPALFAKEPKIKVENLFGASQTLLQRHDADARVLHISPAFCIEQREQAMPVVGVAAGGLSVASKTCFLGLILFVFNVVRSPGSGILQRLVRFDQVAELSVVLVAGGVRMQLAGQVSKNALDGFNVCIRTHLENFVVVDEFFVVH